MIKNKTQYKNIPKKTNKEIYQEIHEKITPIGELIIKDFQQERRELFETILCDLYNI